MPSLSLIATEARRLIGALHESQRHSMQKELVALCETRWREIRGPEPDSMLGRVRWSVTPMWSDLLLDLYAAGDIRLDEVVQRSGLAKALALLVLVEIERGDEVGVHIAHEPMMAFESTPPPEPWLARIASLLRGTLTPPPLHRHDSRESLWKALAVIAVHTGRLDLPAVLQVIGVLAAPPAAAAAERDETLEALRDEVLEVGIRFLGIDDDHILYEQHGHEHKPVRSRHVGEMLLEIREKWLR